jgi:hypothetical protein
MFHVEHPRVSGRFALDWESFHVEQPRLLGLRTVATDGDDFGQTVHLEHLGLRRKLVCGYPALENWAGTGFRIYSYGALKLST